MAAILRFCSRVGRSVRRYINSKMIAYMSRYIIDKTKKILNITSALGTFVNAIVYADIQTVIYPFIQAAT